MIKQKQRKSDSLVYKPMLIYKQIISAKAFLRKFHWKFKIFWSVVSSPNVHRLCV